VQSEFSTRPENHIMSNYEFSDGMKRLLRHHPALPTGRTRELARDFNSAQANVCQWIASLGYPLARLAQELRAGTLDYFREGSDQDRKRNCGKKSSYRFAGFAPSHVEEYERRAAARAAGELSAEAFQTWQVGFLLGFTFEVIEQVALRAFPVPTPAPGELGTAQMRGRMAEGLLQARRVRDEILGGNLLLVAKIVIQRGRSYPTIVVDDLFAAGTDGLMIAIGRYDPAVGQFSTYATPWIKMAIDRFVAKTRNVIRIPIGMQEKARRLRSQTGEGAAAAIAEIESLIPEVQSLEEPMPGIGEGQLHLEDVVADPASARPLESAEQADIARILHERLAKLDDLKQFIIAMRNDIGDAAALGAKLFREEVALSLGRGRATASAASKSLEEPARLRLIGAAAPMAAPSADVEAELACAV
jgi:RNA polymerase sigma factor (sigma-70 family)